MGWHNVSRTDYYIDPPSQPAKALLMAIANSADDDTGALWFAIKRIAKRVKLAPNTVRKYIDEFVELGVLIVVAEESGRRSRSYVYDVDRACVLWPMEDPDEGLDPDRRFVRRGSNLNPNGKADENRRGSNFDRRGSNSDRRGATVEPEKSEKREKRAAGDAPTERSAVAASPPDGGGDDRPQPSMAADQDDPGNRQRPIGAHWLACQDALRAAVGEDDWRTWLRGSKGERDGPPLLICEFDDGDRMKLATPTALLAALIAERFGETLDRVTGRKVEVFKFDETDRRARRERLARQAKGEAA